MQWLQDLGSLKNAIIIGLGAIQICNDYRTWGHSKMQWLQDLGPQKCNDYRTWGLKNVMITGPAAIKKWKITGPGAIQKCNDYRSWGHSKLQWLQQYITLSFVSGSSTNHWTITWLLHQCLVNEYVLSHYMELKFWYPSKTHNSDTKNKQKNVYKNSNNRCQLYL